MIGATMTFAAIALLAFLVAFAGAGFYVRTREHPSGSWRTTTPGRLLALRLAAYSLLVIGVAGVLAGSAGVLVTELAL